MNNDIKNKIYKESVLWTDNDRLYLKHTKKINKFYLTNIKNAKLVKTKNKSYDFVVTFISLLFIASYFFYFNIFILILHVFTHVFFYFYLSQYQYIFVIFAHNECYKFKINSADKEIYKSFLRELSIRNHVFESANNKINHGTITTSKYI